MNMLDTVFFQILNCSITASAVIVFVLLARILLRKAPKIFSYALWAVVLFRLLCPFSLESTVSLLPVNPVSIQEDIVYAQKPEIDTGIAAIDDAVNPILPPATYYSSINPLQFTAILAARFWVFGVLFFLLWGAVSFWRLRRRLVGAVRLRDNIYLADRIDTPFVSGVVRPKIYLPSALPEEERVHIILHEQGRSLA